ncbi:MAG: hypothetical protein IJX51_01110 [Clostridia bacterium]|nr:hypothetical protein [Clostridia bacterium]
MKSNPSNIHPAKQDFIVKTISSTEVGFTRQRRICLRDTPLSVKRITSFCVAGSYNDRKREQIGFNAEMSSLFLVDLMKSLHGNDEILTSFR